MDVEKSPSHQSVLVRALRERFIEDWQRGPQPDLAEYLVDVEEHSRHDVLRELLSLEIGLRRERGQVPTLAEYVDRFPEDRATIESAFNASQAAFTDSHPASSHPTIISEPSVSPVADLKIGQQLGKYQITGVLGKGGMGIVYAAHDSLILRDVAIKQLGHSQASSETGVMRLLQEARTAGALQHPNVVSIYDVIQEEHQYYLVMEKVTGENLSDLMLKSPHKCIEWQTATRILIDCCDGLIAAHTMGLIHRDIKPQNIMITQSLRAKILDFGLAKSEQSENTAKTEAGTVLGTPDFMSPEQFRGDPVDARTDLYSLGATYYALLTGESPFAKAGNQMQVMYAHGHSPIPYVADRLPSVPEGCDQIIHRAMAKDPPDRFESAVDFKTALTSLLVNRGVSLEPLERNAKRSSKRKLPLTTLIVMLSLVAMMWLVLPKPRHRQKDDVQDATNHSAAAAVPAATTVPLVFGCSTAFSGANRELGQKTVAGIRAGFSVANDQGGIHGRPLQLVVLDDAYDPARALENMKELIERRNVFGVIGNAGTETAKLTAPYSIEHRKLFFAPFSGAAFLRQDPPDRYVFNYRASSADETTAMVNYFVETRRINPKRIAVFAQADSYGDDGFHGVARALKKYQISADQILRVGYPRNTVNVDDAVAAVLQSPEPFDAVIMVATYKPAARFVKQVRHERPQTQFGMVSFVGSLSLAQEFEDLEIDNEQGVLVTQVVPHYLSNATGVLRFREALSKYSPEQNPGFVSLEGFIAAQCLIEGLKRAGSDLTSDKVVDALESIEHLDLGIGPIIRFGPSRHQASHQVWGTRMMNGGKFEIVDLE